MLPLLEHHTKTWLSQSGFPVPKGGAAATADEAMTLARNMPGGCVVKALVPTGRRGKAGAVRLADGPPAAGEVARQLIGGAVAGYRVSQVYVEERIDIADEYYLSFTLAADELRVLVSRQGGVDIEGTFANAPDRIVGASIDPLAGLSSSQAIDLWSRAGVRTSRLHELGDVTSRLFAVFQAADAVTLEINPLAICCDGSLSLVGAMMAVDEHALFRHPQWRGSDNSAVGKSGVNEREESVRRANADFPGGEAQYQELDGNIGLLVGGGGAGLYIHDLIVTMGGRPANHCVTPPTGRDTRKLKAVLRAILDNPRLRGLLVGFNFAQMARADIRVQALAEVLRERSSQPLSLPIVVRLFGPGEDKARQIAAEFPNITYLPRGTSLLDACRTIVERTRNAA